jgi:hypothetical protein
MNGVTAAMLVVLGLSGPWGAPDLQVEAATAGGVSLPELADAVARALVAGGARVVLRGPSSGPCQYCAKVTVTEIGSGTCRVEVSQERHAASSTLQLPAGSPLLDRARAIAIQARLLVTWETSSETKSKETAARPSERKSEGKTTAERAEPPSEITRDGPATATAPRRAPGSGVQPEPGRAPAREPAPLVERRTDAAPVAPAKSADRREPEPTERVDTKVAEPLRAEARRPPPADITAASPTPSQPQWPWISTALGAGAAVGAGICALVARNRYNALADKTQTYESAKEIKLEGESWQLASFVLAGAAAVGLGTGIVGFATRTPVTALASPIPGGGMIAIAGQLP